MFTSIDRFKTNFFMGVIGSSNVDNVHIFVSKKLIIRSIETWNFEFLSKFFSSFKRPCSTSFKGMLSINLIFYFLPFIAFKLFAALPQASLNSCIKIDIQSEYKLFKSPKKKLDLELTLTLV
ncbi:hypothetical protein BpHYR1_034126 [Brachionus plicatilis]|uniref:Uncharacterized protein n=1 Tax=Brachionus plicatilis TaxID=10195 RepID=A0A3M7SB90_BRAPC|nr:hypothetical protein BpHYR1_034126 [Brachionus plicatilis]